MELLNLKDEESIHFDCKKGGFNNLKQMIIKGIVGQTIPIAHNAISKYGENSYTQKSVMIHTLLIRIRLNSVLSKIRKKV